MWDIKVKLTDADRQQCGDYQREGGEGKSGINGNGENLTWGGEHTIQYTDDVL